MSVSQPAHIICIALLVACQFTAQAQPSAALTPTPVSQRLPVTLLPDGPPPPPAPAPLPGQPGYVAPPPPSGSRDGFSYAPSTEFEGFTTVYPTDGSEPINVSSTFLDVSLRGSRSDADTLQSARNYEKMTAGIADKFMGQFFPDSTADSANLKPTALQGTQQDLVVEQDPLAGPYARITVTDKEGNVVSQYSVSAGSAALIMDQPYLTTEQKIEKLSKSDFHLPESARQKFNSMTPEQLRQMVLEKPELANQEFIKAARMVAAEKAKADAQAGRKSGPDKQASESLAAATRPRPERPPDETPARDVATRASETETHPTADVNNTANANGLPNGTGFSKQTAAVVALAIIGVSVLGFGIYKLRRF